MAKIHAPTIGNEVVLLSHHTSVISSWSIMWRMRFSLTALVLHISVSSMQSKNPIRSILQPAAEVFTSPTRPSCNDSKEMPIQPYVRKNSGDAREIRSFHQQNHGNYVNSLDQILDQADQAELAKVYQTSASGVFAFVYSTLRLSQPTQLITSQV